MKHTRNKHKQNAIAAKKRIKRKKAAKEQHLKAKPEERIWEGSRHTGKPLKDLPMRYLMAQAKLALKFERGFLLDEIARRRKLGID